MSLLIPAFIPQRVPPELSNGKVRRYVVFIKATGPYRFSEAQNISAGTALNLTIKGLFAWTKYNISVQAVTIRPGPMTPWKQVQTFEDGKWCLELVIPGREICELTHPA